MPSRYNPQPVAGPRKTIFTGYAFIVASVSLFVVIIWLMASGRLEPSPWLMPVWIFVFVLLSMGCFLAFRCRPMDVVEGTIRLKDSFGASDKRPGDPPEA